MNSSARDADAARHLARLEEVRRGEPQAVDAWFRSEHPEVYRLCFGFLADNAEAEDVAQDAMLHLLDRLEGWDSNRPYRSWRDTVVLNLCRDRARRNEARGRAHVAAAALTAESKRTGALPSAGDPHGELERREVREVLMESLAALSPREREVFVLRDLEERSTSDAATCLGVTDSTVRSLLTLARRRLRGILDERLPGIESMGGEGV